jgi:hypothetical protein
MRKTIIAIAVLAVIAACGHSEPKLNMLRTDTLSFAASSAQDTSFYLSLPNWWELGTIVLDCRYDSVSGAAVDSVLLQYRITKDKTRKYYDEASSVIGFSPLKIYKGGTTFVDWTYTTTISDEWWRYCSIEMGGIPWMYVQINLVRVVNGAGHTGKGRFIITTYYK